MRNYIAAILLSLLALSAVMGEVVNPKFVSESARDIPIAYQVDVVVIGGSTGGVAAAAAAASEGASVFLAAPRPYLGDDMTATLRLWLEEGEAPTAPIAKELFAERHRQHAIPDAENALAFKYEADLPSTGVHKDTRKPSLLSDGLWGTAVRQSVQYNGDVNITVDLLREQELSKAYVMVYHTNDFQVTSVTIYTSRNRKKWKKITTIMNNAPPQSSVNEAALVLSASVAERARYLKFFIKKAPGSTRVLVGEIMVTKIGKNKPTPKPVKIPPARPFYIKKTLDKVLLSAGVSYLYSCYATDVLHDERGNPAGIVIANRAGRQAVIAKVIIDATDRAWVARMAGAKFHPFPKGIQIVKRVVIGGEARTGDNIRSRKIDPPFMFGPHPYNIIEYTLQIPMRNGSYTSWAEAEQTARDMTYQPSQQFASDILFQIPPDPIRGQVHISGGWRGVDALDTGAFRPANIPRFFVLGGCADIPRSQAEKLLRPPALIDMGTYVGIAAAKEAKSLSTPKGVKLPGGKIHSTMSGDVREILAGIRPIQKLTTIHQEERMLPVLGSYDVVVIGGGTSGAPAGIAAARQGTKTLVVEYLYGLGGVGTQGAISKYYWGNKVGFTREVRGGSSWAIEDKMEWWRTTLRKAGADIWFGVLGCGAFVEDGYVRGVVIATPEGRGVVLAKVVIDSTGNADIAASAGASCVYTDATDIAVQGTGLPPRYLGASYTNTDFTIVDETDMIDVWRVFIYAKFKTDDAFDIGQLIDTRERRRIVGDFTISILDQVNKRTYPDTIVEAYSDFDTHGYTIHPYFTLQHPRRGKGLHTNIPYRALLPKGLEGILVTGLGISAHRDALPVIRMQADIQNQGYAAGVAAAMAAKAGVPPREIDVRALQRHLVKIGNLPKKVLTEKDSYPIPVERIADAVDTVKDNYKDVAIILANPEQSLPLLHKAYASAKSDEHKLIYAHILAVLGDATGIPTLIAAVQSIPGLGEGWRYKSAGQYNRNMGKLDSLIYAMGRTRDRRAVAPILAKLKLLKPNSSFSHFRAMALALEMIGDPKAAKPLADILSMPGLRGYAITTIDDSIQCTKKWPGWSTTAPRSNAIRELTLARALYRCGDKDDIGRKILEAYTKDLRGHFARHAYAVLELRRKQRE